MSTQDNINEIAKIIQKAMTAQEAASRGLVPQSGNPDKPGRWIRDPKAEGKTGGQKDSSKEAVLRDRDYTYDEKEGVVKISEKNFKKVPKDSKNTTKGEERMLVLTERGTTSVPVKFTDEPKSPNESIDMSDSWGRDSDPLSPNIKDFALPLNPNKTIDGKKYRVRGVRDSEKGQEAVIWADNQSYLIRKPKNGKWSKPIKTK
tara:strand:- start:93 stop:701 length:609 start_codon:yes stop_codon:yes gene_type:complete